MARIRLDYKFFLYKFEFAMIELTMLKVLLALTVMWRLNHTCSP